MKKFWFVGNFCADELAKDPRRLISKKLYILCFIMSKSTATAVVEPWIDLKMNQNTFLLWIAINRASILAICPDVVVGQFFHSHHVYKTY